MLTWICTLLTWLPGEIEKEVNLVKMTEVVAAAERAKPGLASAIQAVIDHKDEVFHNDLYTRMAVQLLVHVANGLSHKKSDPSQPASA